MVGQDDEQALGVGLLEGLLCLAAGQHLLARRAVSWLVLECKAKGPEQAADAGTLAQLLDGVTSELELRLHDDGFTVSRESGSFETSLVYARPSGIDGRAQIHITMMSPGSRRDSTRSAPEASVEYRIEAYEGPWDYAGPDTASPTPRPTEPPVAHDSHAPPIDRSTHRSRVDRCRYDPSSIKTMASLAASSRGCACSGLSRPLRTSAST